jgi:hypothetical protein
MGMNERIRISPIDLHVAKITTTWRKAAESIIETGRLLIRAKGELKHGQFGEMIADKLPFKSRTAQMLMEIAKHHVISNAKFASVLPPSWSTLYAITKLPVPESEMERMLSNGTIHSEMQRRDVEALSDTIKNLGVFQFDRIPELLHGLLAFMAQWPDAKALAAYVEGDDEDDERGVSLERLAKLPAWISDLHAGVRARIKSEISRS